MSAKLPELRILEFVPRPCRHEVRMGRPHRSNAALIRCLAKFGCPGFDIVKEVTA